MSASSPPADVGDPELFEPYRRLGPVPYLRSTLASLPVVVLEARTEVQSRVSNYRWGLLWILLQPALLTLVYLLVFGILIDGRSRTDGIPFLPFLALGKYAFNSVGDAIRQGLVLARSADNYEIDRTLASVLLARSLSSFMQSGGELVVAVLLTIASGISLGLDWILVPILVILAFAMALGFGACLALVSVFFADFVFVYNSVIRLAFFASGVVIPVEKFVLEGHGERVLNWFALGNPLFALVKLWQHYLLGYDSVGLSVLWTSVLFWTLVPLVVGMLAIYRLEEHRWWMQ